MHEVHAYPRHFYLSKIRRAKSVKIWAKSMKMFAKYLKILVLANYLKIREAMAPSV